MKNSAPQRFAIGVGVIIQIILIAAMVVVANLAIHRWHPKKMEWTKSDYYKLSEKTQKMLTDLKESVDVIVFFQPGGDGVTGRVYNDIQKLLEEYQNVSKKIRVEYVDPDRNPLKAEKLAKEYNVKVPNVVVFSFKTAAMENPRSKYVQVNDLIELERSNPYMGGGGGKIKAFKGEQQFSSAIQNILEEKQSKVYFLEGHGEGSTQDSDPKKGCSAILKYLKRDNLVVEKLNLSQTPQVPKDCEVLIIAGPTHALSDFELKGVQEYLNANGRAVVMLDALSPETGLEKIFAEYGVKVGNDMVVFKIRDRLGGEALVPSAPGMDYAKHPVTESLQSDDVSVMFPMSRSVDKLSSADSSKFKVTVLLKSPEMSWAETDLEKLRKQQEAQQDDKDRKGPIPLGLAIEPSSAGEVERDGMRLVVFGSSGFVRNGGLTGGNMDLFMNSVNWLLKRQALLGISPKLPQEFSLKLNPFQVRGVFFTTVIIMPLVVAVIGVIVWMRRRK